MALTREQKKARVQEARETLGSAVAVVFVTYDALALADMNELRDQLFEAGVSMRVIPKRLLKLAVIEAKLDFDPTAQEGQMALVWGDDVVSPAKVLAEFAKKHEQLQLVGGVMERSVISDFEVKRLATIPSREELLRQLVGMLAGPLSGFQAVLSGVPRSAVFVLAAIKESKQE
jgi:large subunit ribosomal protein L10